MICTTASQQGRMAAGARSCNGVLGGYLRNASVGMTMDSKAFAVETGHVVTTTKRRPARHLGAPPS